VVSRHLVFQESRYRGAAALRAVMKTVNLAAFLVHAQEKGMRPSLCSTSPNSTNVGAPMTLYLSYRCINLLIASLRWRVVCTTVLQAPVCRVTSDLQLGLSVLSLILLRFVLISMPMPLIYEAACEE